MKQPRFCLPNWALTFSVILMMLACNFLQGPANDLPMSVPKDDAEPVSTSEPVQDHTSTEEPAPEEPGALDDLLGLRSIQLDLTALYPDGTLRSMQARIDAAGNMHVKFVLPDTTLPDELKKAELPPFQTDAELYAVDGNIYQPNEEEKWEAAPEPIDYWEELSDHLHGPEGPGLWLNILADEDLQSAGQETVGGFSSDKYNVNGLIENQAITGTVWFDRESQALVQAELHIPAELLSLSEKPEPGELTITLQTQKAEIPAITVPK